MSRWQIGKTFSLIWPLFDTIYMLIPADYLQIWNTLTVQTFHMSWKMSLYIKIHFFDPSYLQNFDVISQQLWIKIQLFSKLQRNKQIKQKLDSYLSDTDLTNSIEFKILENIEITRTCEYNRWLNPNRMGVEGVAQTSVISSNVGRSPRNILTFRFNPFATLLWDSIKLEPRPPLKKLAFWWNPYKTEIMITSLIEMLELPKLNLMFTAAISFSSHDKIWLVKSWTEIMTSKPFFQNTFKVAIMFIKINFASMSL